MRLALSPRTRSVRRQRGMAVVVVLTLLSIILIYVTANLRALYGLEWELKLTERRQLNRLNALSATNAAALAIPAPAQPAAQ